MKREKYIIMMVVAVAAMVLMPIAPCRAYWTYLGSNVSGGSPDSDSDSEDGYEYEWSWSYNVTGINRGGDSGGSWASASMSANTLVEVWSFNGSSVSKSKGIGPSVWGDSYYADFLNPIYDPGDLNYDWDVSASGTVTVDGYVDDGDLDSGDTVDASSFADGDAGGYESGGGYANGSVYEYSTGYADAGPYGEATGDTPSITESAGYYYASVSVIVDAYDGDFVPGGEGNSFGAGASISVYVSADASISASQGYSGSAGASADVGFGGYGIVSVSLP